MQTYSDQVILSIRTSGVFALACSSLTSCSSLLLPPHSCKTYNVASQYMRKESIISTTVVALIGSIQLATFAIYDLALAIFSHLSELDPSDHDTNVIGWLYTGPFNAVISPSVVLAYIYFIKRTRKCKIKTLTKHTSNHLDLLYMSWNKV
ncbi:unnamed protein product [Caenorhabditis sp. 36 PRJEB53466]|nr:unnamed protein product [Caenorhabditis sp. 36 PRJEB53466]